jgi:hypothetical protein
MNELAIQELSNSFFVRSRIFTIRGVQVMLDRGRKFRPQDLCKKEYNLAA